MSNIMFKSTKRSFVKTMKKNTIKMTEVCNKTNNVNSPSKHYYMAVDDIKCFVGKRGKMQPCDVIHNNIQDGARLMNMKFVDDPKKAAEMVYLNQIYKNIGTNRPFYDTEVKNKFWKNAVWNEKDQVLIVNEYRTMGTFAEPKQCQMEEFNRGKYEFFLIRHEIQVLKTDLVNLDQFTISTVEKKAE